MKKLFGSLPAVLLSLTLAPHLSAAVCADPNGCIFTFNTTNGGTIGNFGTVTLTKSGSDILVDVKLASGFHLIENGSHQSFDFNDNGAATPVTQSGWSDARYSQDSPPLFHDDGFGAFMDAVHANVSPFSSGVNELTFKVLGHTNVNDIVGLSSGGTYNAYFAADVFVDSCGGIPDFGSSCTGLVGVTGGGGTLAGAPEPGSYLGLLMGGLGAMLWVKRRRNRLTAE
jgi:hypothetical protein